MNVNSQQKNIVWWKKLVERAPPAYVVWFAAEKEFFKEHVKKNAEVLEVGCGDGRSLRDLSSITTNLTGIDNDSRALADARKTLQNYSAIRLLFAEGEHLPFPSESFDVITCIGTFSNFARKKYKILAEMKRVLRKDGCIIISAYSEKAFEERMKMYKSIAGDSIVQVRD
ncbi:MAG: class I SAM-dependent methyltransferase, partial [Candidatus Woesearchaeota archaeon]|nr:class I SAM-dependent methyltransferase [Candidatus Woesearchaeota archaeon]